MKSIDFSIDAISQYWIQHSDRLWAELETLDSLEPWTIPMNELNFEYSSFFDVLPSLDKSFFMLYSEDVLKLAYFMPFSCFLRFIAWLNIESGHNGIFIHLLVESRKQKDHNKHALSFFERINFLATHQHLKLIMNPPLITLTEKIFTFNLLAN